MTQYIDKSAVSAEINRRLEVLSKDRDFNYLQIKELNTLLSSLDALELKEVDLEKEIEEVKHNYKVDDNRHTSICSADIEWLANHFFELGLSVNNPITAADKGTAEEIILALNTLGEEKMISYDKEIEWLNKIKEL